MSFFPRFSPVLTSYDLLKTFAVITMVIDHVGFFFYPDILWFRVIGRLSAPCWLFLIGYARTRDIPLTLAGGAAALVLNNIIIGQYILPLNILISMVLWRTILDRLTAIVFASGERIIHFFVFAAIMSVPLYFLIEYSTYGLLLVLAGYAVRNRGETCLSLWGERIFMIASMALYGAGMSLFFGIQNWMQLVPLGAALILLGYLLYRFAPREYPGLTQKMPQPLFAFFQLCGRYSLEIYVGHLILFHIAAIYTGEHKLHWLHPTMFPQ